MKNIKYILLILLFLTGCHSFEQELAHDLVANTEQTLSLCKITGFPYHGIKDHLNQKQTLKVLMIHGIGTHHPGYSMPLQQNLAAQIGFNVLSRVPKNMTLIDKADQKTPIGNLRVTLWENTTDSRQMLFYELTWSEITQSYKKILSFDMTEEYTSDRVPFNNTMKGFLDNLLPDPMIYLTDPHHLILHAGQQAFCWMLASKWETFPTDKKANCPLPTTDIVGKMADENILFITHSLGSEILTDTIVSVADAIESEQLHQSPALSDKINKLQNKKLTVFMMANQLPILRIDKPKPRVHNQIAAYCEPNGTDYAKRLFKGLNIVAFTDPNDILSYEIPQTFADTYLDSRLCPLVSNVTVNVAPEIAAFGIGVVNPITAHTAYDTNKKVISLMVSGTENFKADTTLNHMCRMISLKDNNRMDAD